MQKYKCHKIVDAMKIDTWVAHSDGSATLIGHDKQEVEVGEPWMERHKPGISGYYVRYEDDYSSWSPAEVFEAGYTAVDSR